MGGLRKEELNAEFRRIPGLERTSISQFQRANPASCTLAAVPRAPTPHATYRRFLESRVTNGNGAKPSSFKNPLCTVVAFTISASILTSSA